MSNNISCVLEFAESKELDVGAKASVEGATAKIEYQEIVSAANEDEYFTSVGDIVDSTKNTAVRLIKYFNNILS